MSVVSAKQPVILLAHTPPSVSIKGKLPLTWETLFKTKLPAPYFAFPEV